MSVRVVRTVRSTAIFKNVELYGFDGMYNGETIQVFPNHGTAGVLQSVQELIEVNLNSEWRQIESGEYYLFVQVALERGTLGVISKDGRRPRVELENSDLIKVDDRIKIHVTKMQKDRQPGETPGDPMGHMGVSEVDSDGSAAGRMNANGISSNSSAMDPEEIDSGIDSDASAVDSMSS